MKPLFHCLQVAGLQELVQLCVAHWSWQLRQLDESAVPDEAAAAMLSAALHFLATFYSHSIDPGAIPRLDDLCSRHVVRLLKSPAMANLAARFAHHSNLAAGEEVKSVSRCPETLPSIGSTAEGGQVLPVISPPVPFPLPAAVFRLLRIWKLKSSSAHQVGYSNFVYNSEI